MNYNHPYKNDSTTVVITMCAIVFVSFTFLWLYFFQADMMAALQHALSEGQTHYNRIIGALVITTVLCLFQSGIYRVTKLSRYTHALTYFPSVLLLAILSSVRLEMDNTLGMSYWLWLAPLLTVIWLLTVLAARTIQPYETQGGRGVFSKCVWVNVLLLCMSFLFIAIMGNTNAAFHYRMHAETALLEGNNDEALRVGEQSLETDANLTMVRMYALSRKGMLGERLFHYPVEMTCEDMLPTAGTVQFLLYPVDSLYRHLGAIPRHLMKPMDYLKSILHSGQAKSAAKDYLLCGYLIDRDLDGFVRTLTRYYPVNDSLPRHYREALVLYNHQRSNPVIVYHDPVLDVDFMDMRELESSCGLDSERHNKALENYANSYWYYYDYQK